MIERTKAEVTVLECAGLAWSQSTLAGLAAVLALPLSAPYRRVQLAG